MAQKLILAKFISSASNTLTLTGYKIVTGGLNKETGGQGKIFG